MDKGCKNIGVVIDSDDYFNELSKEKNANFIRLDYTNDLQPKPKLSNLIYEGQEIHGVFIYLHIKISSRSNFNGIHWFTKNLRRKNYNTPVIILSWLKEYKFVYKLMKANPFVTSYGRKSCKIIQLPLGSGDILKELNILEDLQEEDKKRCEDFCISGSTHKTSK